MSRQMKLAKAVLGDSLYGALTKAIVKLPTRTVVDITEAHDALQIAPKSVMTFLMKETQDMEDGGAKEIKVPFGENVMMLLNKMTADQYTGHFVKDGKIIHQFQHASIPQLSSHILSVFELYDESPANESNSSSETSKEATKEGTLEASPGDAKMAQAIEELRTKVDQLFMMVAQKPQQIIVNTAPAEKPGLEKSDATSEKNKKLKNILRKAGLAPTMPKPKKPGVNAGTQGISRAGLHGPKTAHSDLNTHIQTATKNPYLKTTPIAGATSATPKQPKQKTDIPKTPGAAKQPAMGKTLTFNKSELSNQCQDCGKTGHCLCFKALSKPTIKKSEDGKVTLHFDVDWDVASLQAFCQSIKRIRDEQ